MKKLGILLACFFSVHFSFAQGNALRPHLCAVADSAGKTVYELCNGVKFNGFRSNDGFERVVKRITGLIGLKPNFILVPCPNIQNCAALNYDDNLRYIVYDKVFMDEIAHSVGTNWTHTMILAHEIGHHLNGHTLRQVNKEESREEELEADEFAGFILGKLGATLNQAVAAMDGLPHPECDIEYFSDHPCKVKRVAAIRKGWAKATGKLIPTAKQKAAQNKTYPVTRGILTGTWYTELDNERNTDGFIPLTISFSDATTIHYKFFNAKGDSVITEYDSKFTLKNGILTEELPYVNGETKATARVEMISNRAFLLTIIDNGTPGYEGLKRVYVKLKEEE
ncbi:MAG: M48 family metalloprotease [Ferruginibacter sp.]